MKKAVLTVTSDGNCVVVVVEGDDEAVALTMTPADARVLAAKLLKEAYDVDVAALFVRGVGEA